MILTESRRLERLVRDLLDLARLESRQFTLDLATVDLADVADRDRRRLPAGCARRAGMTLTTTGRRSGMRRATPIPTASRRSWRTWWTTR